MMKILNATMNAAMSGSHMAKFRAVTRDAGSGGDSASFSQDALSLSGMANAKFSTSTMTAKVGSDDVSFNSKTGAISWGGTKLNLKGVGNALSDDLVIQKNSDGTFNVHNMTTPANSAKLGADGKMLKDADGKKVDADPLTASDRLVINNKGGATAGDAGNDVIINRQAGASLNGGAGNDQIFNFATTLGTVDAGTGDDAVYSVGLRAGTIDTGNGDEKAYVKLLGNLSSTTINVGAGQNVIDAAGKNLDSATITDQAGATTALKAKNVSNSTITLQGKKAGLDLNQLADSTLTLGTGANSLIADTLKNSTVNTGKGSDNSFQFKTVNAGQINSAQSNSDVINITGSAKKSTFNMGTGGNTLNATGKTLTSVTITDKVGASTSVLAGAIGGTSSDKSTINLVGAGVDGSGVSVSGTINHAQISTLGKGELYAGAVNNSTVAMSTGTTDDQVVNIKGNLTNSSLSTGKGDDKVFVGGSANKSTVDLGDGDNSLDIVKSVNGLTYRGGSGNDDVRISGAMSNSDIDLGGGTNSLLVKNAKNKGQKVSNTTVSSTGAATTIEMGAYVGGTNGAFNLGSGVNTITLGSVNGKGTLGLSIISDASSTNSQTLNIAGAAKNLNYIGRAGDDTVNISGALTNGNIDLGGGTNSLTVINAAGKGQKVSNTNISASSSALSHNTVSMGAYSYGKDGNVFNMGQGKNEVTLTGGISGKGSVGLTFDASQSSQDQSLTIGGSVKSLNYKGASGTDTLNVSGAISNSQFDLGGGDNSLTALKYTKKGGVVGQALNNVSITADGAAGDVNTITAGAFKAGKDGNTIDLGSGANSVYLSSIAGAKTSGLTLKMGGAENQMLHVSGAVKNLTYTGSSGSDTIIVSGAISNSLFDLGGGDNSLTAAKANKKGVSVGQALNNVSITANGAATNSNTITAGAFKSGKDGNSIDLGSGANTVNLSSIAGVKSAGLTIKMSGTNAQALNVAGAVKNLNYIGSSGADTLSISGAISNSTLNLGEGLNELSAVKPNKNGSKTVAQTLNNVNIYAGGTDGTSLNVGAFKFGKDGNTIDLGDGPNTVSMTSVGGKGTVGLELNMGTAGTADQTLNISGKSNRVHYTGSGGEDKINVSGAASNSTYDLGEGMNTFLAEKANKKGDRVGVAVNNTNIKASGNGTLSLTMGDYKVAKGGSEMDLGTASNIINMKSISGGKLTIKTGDTTNSQTINISGAAKNLTFIGSSGADTVNISGALSNVLLDLGEGDNSVNATGGNSVNTTVTADGTGANSVALKGLGTKNKGASGISLGDGANTVSISNALSGKTNIDMGGGTGSSLTIGTITNSSKDNTVITGSGGGTITVTGKAGAAKYDFAAAISGYSLNFHNDLAGSVINFGGESNELVMGTTDGRTSIINSEINAGTGSLSVDAKDMTKTTINGQDMLSGSNLGVTLGGTLSGGTLNYGSGGGTLTMTKGTGKANINLGAGAVTVNASGGLTNVNVSGTDSGAFTLNAGKVEGGTLNISSGSTTTLNVDGGLNTTVIGKGAGAFDINVTNGAVAGMLDIMGDLTVSATTMNKANVTAGGSNTQLNVSNAITDSKLNLTGDLATVGVSGNTTFSNTTITGGTGSATVQGGSYTGGSLTFSTGANTVAVKDMHNVNMSLGGGNNTVGVANAVLQNVKVTAGDGNNTFIAGTFSGTGTFGDGNNTFQVDQSLSGKLTFGDGTNVVGTTGVTIQDLDIQSGNGSLTVNGKDYTGGKINMAGTGSLRMDSLASMSNLDVNLASADFEIGKLTTAYSNVNIKSQGGSGNINGDNFTKGSISLLGNGTASVNLTGLVTGDITLGSGNYTVGNGQTTFGASLTLGGGTTEVNLNEQLAGSTISGQGNNKIYAKKSSGKIDGSAMGADTLISVGDLASGGVINAAAGSTVGVNNVLTGATVNNTSGTGASSIDIGTLGGTINIGGSVTAGSKLHVNQGTFAGSVKFGSGAATGGFTVGGGTKNDPAEFSGSHVTINNTPVTQAGTYGDTKSSYSYGEKP